MQPNFQEEDDDLEGVDFEEDEDFEKSATDMADYSNSEEAKQVSWWDWTKDVALQSVRGVGQAFTWPLEILKLGMIGEGLSGIDELEEAYKTAGKDFDKNEYIQTILGESKNIPTQSFFEDYIKEATGFDFEPKTESGKFVNKAATIAKLSKGPPLGRLLTGTSAAATKKGLQSIGVNEPVADLTGDLVSGGKEALKKTARIFTPEAEKLKKISDRFGLPFYEFMTKPTGGIITPKISQAREAAIRKELGVSSEQAAKKIIEGKIPLSKLRKQGVNLNEFETEAYRKVDELASSYKKPIKTDNIISDIKTEVSKIKKTSPSPSDAEKTYMNILEEESKHLSNPAKKEAILGPNGESLNSTERLPKEISAEQLIKQHKNYNSNVKGIYRKPEFSGREESVRDAYAFLNSSIRNTIEKQAGPELSNSFKEANKVFNQRSILNRSEALIDKAFPNGEYNAKKLNQLLNSKQGAILKRDLGDQAIKEISDIAKYGEKAINLTAQVVKKPQFSKEVLTWGMLTPFILGATNKMKGALFLGKPVAEKIKGYLLTRPASREVYSDIIKNAAKGSFRNMKADFGKLSEIVSDEFGSPDEFIKKIIDDLQVYEGEF